MYFWVFIDLYNINVTIEQNKRWIIDTFSMVTLIFNRPINTPKRIK